MLKMYKEKKFLPGRINVGGFPSEQIDGMLRLEVDSAVILPARHQFTSVQVVGTGPRASNLQ